MKFSSNLLKKLVLESIDDLSKIYPSEEAKSLVYWIIEAFFGVTRIQLSMSPDKRLSESEMLKLLFAIKELKNHKPVQYIVGQVPFCGLNIKVSPDVLIPRQETEQLVDWVIESEKSPKKIVDVCSGSGCIALGIKRFFLEAEVLGFDISSAAVDLATENAKENHLEVSFFKESVFSQSVIQLSEIDFLISNPPYVLEREKSEMQPNVLDYEPHLALFVENNEPLRFYDAILKQSESYLKKGGRVYFEINEVLGDDMVALCVDYGFHDIELKNDLNNKPRFIRARK